MVLSTAQARLAWGPHCTPAKVSTRGAYEALDACFKAYDYKPRAGVTGAQNCRPITGGTDWSLHAFAFGLIYMFWTLVRVAMALAVDVNWDKNPYGPRLVTDMPRPMIDAIYRVRTNSGAQVFRWGGYYTGNKDAMHFEIVCTPAELATGINLATLPGATPAPDPTPTPEDDMNRLITGDDGVWWNTDGITKDRVEDQNHAGELAISGLVLWDNGKPFKVPQAMINKIPLATVADAIVWYVGADGKGSHAYRVWGNLGKYLADDVDDPEIALLTFLGLKQANTKATPLDALWRANVVLVDGPSRTLPESTGGVTNVTGLDEDGVGRVLGRVIEDSGLPGLLPGK